MSDQIPETDQIEDADDGSWRVYGVDYHEPPEVGAATEARRAGRRIVVTGVDEEGLATFGYAPAEPELEAQQRPA